MFFPRLVAALIVDLCIVCTALHLPGHNEDIDAIAETNQESALFQGNGRTRTHWVEGRCPAPHRLGRFRSYCAVSELLSDFEQTAIAFDASRCVAGVAAGVDAADRALRQCGGEGCVVFAVNGAKCRPPLADTGAAGTSSGMLQSSVAVVARGESTISGATTPIPLAPHNLPSTRKAALPGSASAATQIGHYPFPASVNASGPPAGLDERRFVLHDGSAERARAFATLERYTEELQKEAVQLTRAAGLAEKADAASLFDAVTRRSRRRAELVLKTAHLQTKEVEAIANRVSQLLAKIESGADLGVLEQSPRNSQALADNVDRKVRLLRLSMENIEHKKIPKLWKLLDEAMRAHVSRGKLRPIERLLRQLQTERVTQGAELEALLAVRRKALSVPNGQATVDANSSSPGVAAAMLGVLPAAVASQKAVTLSSLAAPAGVKSRAAFTRKHAEGRLNVSTSSSSTIAPLGQHSTSTIHTTSSPTSVSPAALAPSAMAVISDAATSPPLPAASSTRPTSTSITVSTSTSGAPPPSTSSFTTPSPAALTDQEAASTTPVALQRAPAALMATREMPCAHRRERPERKLPPKRKRKRWWNRMLGLTPSGRSRGGDVQKQNGSLTELGEKLGRLDRTEPALTDDGIKERPERKLPPKRKLKRWRNRTLRLTPSGRSRGGDVQKQNGSLTELGETFRRLDRTEPTLADDRIKERPKRGLQPKRKLQRWWKRMPGVTPSGRSRGGDVQKQNGSLTELAEKLRRLDRTEPALTDDWIEERLASYVAASPVQTKAQPVVDESRPEN
eukprot:TRINITY_DN331_c0_g1_i1.p1 TRINITY_DN331_c0_g1~~TRINITY_DN331_c0_g1_i1.p1  ORF type:complete len:794 (+),score=106.29 TRINITY_DN331_c0_g1_i1:88-2469(+)